VRQLAEGEHLIRRLPPGNGPSAAQGTGHFFLGAGGGKTGGSDMARRVTSRSASAPALTHAEVAAALRKIVSEKNGGFGLNMWATIVDRDGVVRIVAFSGRDRGDQWPGSRVISAQKANTANAFSLPGLALSTANLYSAVQPGGSLFGLQHSNPVNVEVAYRGDPKRAGAKNDPMVGGRIGGVNVFGGGLPLYNSKGALGDSSCADHIIAWKLRHALCLDYLPGGVSPSKDDNIVHDIVKGVSAGGWGHPSCSPEATQIASRLPKTHPIRKRRLTLF
jgi:hypothetical protein